MKYLLCIILAHASIAPVFALPAIPEPPAILHGTVTDGVTNQPVTITSVTWQVTDGTESGTFSITSTPPAHIVEQSGQSFYVLEVPFETRVIKTADGQSISLTRQGQSLELRSPAPNYTLTTFINDRAATIRSVDGTAASGPALTISNDPATNGKMLRVDLTLPPADPYAVWAAANFSDINAPSAARTADPDGDGATNEQEWAAGTNPNNRASILSVTASTRLANGTWAVTFQTVPGRRYRLMRSDDLSSFTPGGEPFTASSASTTLNIPDAPRQFLKLTALPE